MTFFQTLLEYIKKIFGYTPVLPPVSSVNPPAVPSTPSVTPQQLVILEKTKVLVYTITSAFEGAVLGQINFENISGNFDGQGFSIGFLQWTPGQGSDLPLFQKMYQNHPDVLKVAMGDLYSSFVDSLSWSAQKRKDWAISISGDNVKEPWYSAFIRLCKTKEFQQIQMDYAESKLDDACDYCDSYSLKSIRALALMFDIVVQNGSIKSTTRTRIYSIKEDKEKSLGRSLTELEFLGIIAVERANDSNPRWVADVKSRKLCIVNGHGTVHGDDYNFDKLGLNDEPFRILE